MPQYVVRRNKKDDQIVFGGAARALKMQPVGSVSAKMSSSGNANNLDLIQTDRGEDIGVEYKLLFDIPFNEFRTRQYNSDRTALEAKVSYGTTTTAIAGINQVTEFQTADVSEVGGITGIDTTGLSVFNHINASGVITATAFYGDGSNLTGISGGGGIGTQFTDGQVLNFGDNDDLQIQHHSNGTGIIQNAGSGQLQLRSNEIRLLNAATNEDYAFFRDDGAVELYYDDVKRFETTGYGVTVAGIVSATTFSGDRLLLGTKTEGPGLADNLTVADTGDCGITIRSGTTNYGSIYFSDATSGGGEYRGQIEYNHNTDILRFYSGGTAVLRVDPGKLEVLGDTETDNLEVTENVTVAGIVTAASYYGDGSNLTGIAYTSLSGIPSVPLTVNEFGYYQQYASPVGNGDATAGPRIYDPEPAYSNNPFYYGVTLKPGTEMRWTHHGDASNEKYAVGIWGGALSFTPTNAFNTVYWSRVARFDHDIVDFGTTNFDSKGFTPSAGDHVNYSISTSTSLSLAYNKYTNKLEVHDITGGNREIIATADTAEDGNPVTITFAISQHGALPGITTVTEYEYPSNWYVGYGATSNKLHSNPFSNSDKRDLHPVYWPQRLEQGYEYRFTSLNTSIAEHFYVLGIWSGDTADAYGGRSYNVLNWDTCFSLGTDAVNNFLSPSGADNWLSSGDDNASKNTTVSAATSVTFNKGDILCLNYSPTDGKLRIINETTGYVAFGTSNNAFSNSQIISMGGKQALVDAPTFTKRDQSWEMISYNDAADADYEWRTDGDRNKVNMTATRDLLPGQRIEYRIPSGGFNHYYWIAAGGWQGPTGLSADFGAEVNVDAGSDLYWRWDTGEDTNVNNGWTFNTANSKYDSGHGDWDGGNQYEHHMQYRYRTSDNKVEWWDVSPDNASAPERIATSTSTLGGGAIRMGIMSIQNDIRTSGTHIDLKELTYTVN